jgi:two-component system NtrC family sensor kinase
MPAGGELQVNSCQGEGTIKISFTDTGCGVKKEFQDKIFDAFFTTKEKASGVGLGLSVSYGLIQSLNGTIRLNSQPGKGSQFIIELPLDAAERLT